MLGAYFVTPSLVLRRELRDAVVEYVEPSVNSYSSPSESPPCVHVFVVDTTIRSKDLEEAKTSITKAIQTLPPDDLIGLVTYDGVVRVFDLGHTDVGVAQVLIAHAVDKFPSPAACLLLSNS